MTLLLSHDAWEARRAAAAGPLRALADSIEADLDQVVDRPVHIPTGKALLTRAGGRCARDGALLEFDPFDALHHRCAACGAVYVGDDHRGFWRYWYHLWVAERAVHAAVMFRLRGDQRHAACAASILREYATRYAAYPNQDNVLGPTRVFFSTYLESIWLLQLCIALDTLEGAGARGVEELGVDVRERLIVPSSALLAEYDEGMSNRQAWNVAAQVAAARMLGRDHAVKAIIDAPSGLTGLLANGCLDDGTWYEGENYHMFAHRGLWYGVALAEAAGARIPDALLSRFDAGFAAPFLTALPDMTLPSRRDSQYAISLRQPRFAELCELGLARMDDPRLAGMLGALYTNDSELARGDNGRARGSADVERNLPAMRLDRADLGWRALLFARERLPAVRRVFTGSVLLPAQGIAVFRRDRDRVYAALDYGHSGGGHGHPDRLNLLLMDGNARWLDDMGTGAYVERALHWYRSSLAHNAPFVDGHSQSRAAGVLHAFEDHGAAGWVHAVFDEPATGVRLERIVVMMPDYLIDEVRWSAAFDVTVDLPNHAPIDVAPPGAWVAAPMHGGSGLEDGFEFLRDTEWMPIAGGDVVHLLAPAGQAMRSDARMQVSLVVDGAAELWRAVAPAAPGMGDHRFHVVRARGRTGRIRSVWRWSGTSSVRFDDSATTVVNGNGFSETHFATPKGWHIDFTAGTARSSIELGGVMPLPSAGAVAGAVGKAGTEAGAWQGSSRTVSAFDAPFSAHLHAPDYRRSEETWEEAGCPTADVHLEGDTHAVTIRVNVRKLDALSYRDEATVNALDNEPSEINADGIQVYLVAGTRAGAWTIVGIEGTSRARGRRVRGWEQLELADARWFVTEGGYELTARIGPGKEPFPPEVEFGLIVNESTSGRARRRGQLVLGGAPGEWTYLRGDRHERGRLLPIRLSPGEVV